MRHAFADCLLDTETLTLTRSGAPVSVEPQVFDLIRLLVENPGRVVTRDEIVEEVWKGRIVSESAISARIAAARRAVGCDGKTQAVIRTVARRGLQMVAEVHREPAGPEGGLARPLPDDARQSIRFATAQDGAHLAYAVTGEGSPLFLAWHFPTSLARDWTNPECRAFFDAVGRGRRLLRYDHRGCGQSEPDLAAFDLDRAANDLCAVADAAGFDRFDMLGLSSGAVFATQFAARHPDRVRKLVLMGGYVDGRLRRGAASQGENTDSISALIRDGFAKPGSPMIGAWISAYYPDAGPETVRRWIDNIQHSCTPEALMVMRGMVNTVSLSESLPKVRAPTLVMHARDEAVHPLSEGLKLARGIAGAELCVIDCANHGPFPGMTGFNTFLDRLNAFLGG